MRRFFPKSGINLTADISAILFFPVYPGCAGEMYLHRNSPHTCQIIEQPGNPPAIQPGERIPDVRNLRSDLLHALTWHVILCSRKKMMIIPSMRVFMQNP